MISSMTGYGRASSTNGTKTFSVELKSLNSKITDLRVRCSMRIKEKEHELRRIVLDKVKRGKLELAIDYSSTDGGDGFGLNVPLFKHYHSSLSELSNELNITGNDMLAAILRIPNVVVADSGDMKEEEWKLLQEAIQGAIANFQQFRETEGGAMANDLQQRLTAIMDYLSQIAPFEADRVTRVRERLFKSLEEQVGKERVDENRFEQEVMYYLEKMDINEEKVRLEQHCKYFAEVLEQKRMEKGKKLGFICQEMGREINTLGAKAYSPDIQRFVVNMKDQLEKIKEQVANIV